MRCSPFQTLAIALLLSAGGRAAWAQDAALFSRLDRNQDGQVSADEVNGQAKGLFERLLRTHDANQDGKLSQQEFTAAKKASEDEAPGETAAPTTREVPLAQEPGRLFARADKNSDGKLTKDEVPAPLAPRFEQVDANRDGSLSREEFATAVQRMLAQRPGNPAARPDAAPRGLIALLDTDNNGELSADEIAAASKALAGLDKNKDGKLDRAELATVAPLPSPAGAPPSGFLTQRLREADKNGDGKISKEEVPPRLAPLFERLDANRDGELDRDELRRAAENARP